METEMTESNAQFIARMKRPENDQAAWVAVDKPDLHRMIALAEERVMIEEHRLDVLANKRDFIVTGATEKQFAQNDLSTAIRAVAAKIGEGK